MSDSLGSHGLYSPWNSSGQNTAVGSLSRDLRNPGIKPRSPTLQVDSLPAEPQKVTLKHARFSTNACAQISDLSNATRQGLILKKERNQCFEKGAWIFALQGNQLIRR